jgi:hypothetical protein
MLTRPTLFISKVHPPRKPFITNPAIQKSIKNQNEVDGAIDLLDGHLPKIHLISDMPEPAAYGAKCFTKKAQVPEKHV